MGFFLGRSLNGGAGKTKEHFGSQTIGNPSISACRLGVNF